MASLLKKYGISVCEPSKAMPVVASMISDKDPQVRKSTLGVLRLVYGLSMTLSLLNSTDP
jgi:cytoskeleton-associated protein 5